MTGIHHISERVTFCMASFAKALKNEKGHHGLPVRSSHIITNNNHSLTNQGLHKEERLSYLFTQTVREHNNGFSVLILYEDIHTNCLYVMLCILFFYHRQKKFINAFQVESYIKRDIQTATSFILKRKRRLKNY
jgi:hypothetical protein